MFFQANAMLADAAGSAIAGRVDPNRDADHDRSTTPIWQAAPARRTWAADIPGTITALADSPYFRLGASESYGGKHSTTYGRRKSFQRSSSGDILGQSSGQIVEPMSLQCVAPHPQASRQYSVPPK